MVEIEAKKRSLAGLDCIGEICISADGILVKLPKDNPECARATADLLLAGKQVKFEVPSGTEAVLEQEAVKKKSK